ncbi:MAG: GNAT family N-acetyltransferase, partial [Rhodospirillaceae bacterium]|nr:GNAT family N-acetyltransferase [Rhodospirillaceae bacterium]
VWGQGYGTEAARAVIDYAFGAIGAKSIVSFTLPDNPGSERVMQKAGMAFEKEMMRLDPPAFLVYRLTRKAWDASR